MDPFNLPDGNGLGPDGLPGQPLPPQQPPPEQQNNAAELFGQGTEAGVDAVDVVNDVADVGILDGVGNLFSGAVDLAGSAITGAADVMSGVASGTVDVIGTVASGAGDAVIAVASNIPNVVHGAAEGLGTVVEGAAGAGDGCGSCSVAIVLFFLAAGSAVAAVIR